METSLQLNFYGLIFFAHIIPPFSLVKTKDYLWIFSANF